MRTEKFIISAFGRKNKNDQNFTFPITRTRAKYESKFGITKMKYPQSFSMAVKELIIEWDDYQTEVCGYLHCQAIQDTICGEENQSYLLHQQSGLLHTAVDRAQKQNINSKQLLCFVKPPGRKASFIRIQKDEMHFHTLNIADQAKTQMVRASEYVEHDIELQIKSLFNENEVLPIKNAQVTVEFHVVR